MNGKILKSQLVINSLLISYSKFEPENKKFEPIIFLHGWGCDQTIWNQILPKLEEVPADLFFLDLPGFGNSQISNKPFKLENYSDLIREFILRLKLNRVILIGHSVGGAIGLKLAIRNSELLKYLIIVDSSGIRLDTFKKRTIKKIAKIVSPIFKSDKFQPIKKQIYRVLGSEDYLANPEMKETYTLIVNDDLTPELKDIKTPTLIIWGKNDQDTPLWQGELIHQLVSNSILKIIDSAGHFSFIDQPSLFIKFIKNFLNVQTI